MKKYLISLAVLAIIIVPVATNASVLSLINSAINRIVAVMGRSQVAAIGGISSPGLPDFTIGNVKLTTATTTPTFSLNLCNNGTASLSDLGSGALGFYAFTFNSQGALSKRYSSSLGGSTLSALKNGRCISSSYPLRADQAVEYRTMPKILFSVNGLPEIDTPDNNYYIYGTSTVPSVADLSVTLSLNSPASSSVPVSTVLSTNVYLASFRFKSSNVSSTINSLKVKLVKNPAGGMTWSLSNATLRDGSASYSASSVANDGTVTFNNLSIPLALNFTKDLNVFVDVFPTSTQFTVLPFLDVSEISAVDANYNVPTIGGGKVSSSTADVFGNLLTMSPNSLRVFAGNISPLVAVPNGNQATIAYTSNFSITLTNPMSVPLYVPTTAEKMLGISTTPYCSSSTAYLIAPTALAGDTANAYIIPAVGGRTFNFIAKVSRLPGSTRQLMSVNFVNYGLTSDGVVKSATTDTLSTLRWTANF